MSDLCVHDGGQIRQVAPDLERLTFQIKPVPPFRLDLTVQALRRRAINAVDRWDGMTFRRALVVDRRSLGIEVVQIAPSERPLLQVTVSGSSLPPSTRPVTMSALTRLLGVDRCLDDFYRAAAHDAGLGHLAHLFRGLKPPRFPTLFEALVNAFACQQVTLSLGIQLLNRLAATCARGGDVPAIEPMSSLLRLTSRGAKLTSSAPWASAGRRGKPSSSLRASSLGAMSISTSSSVSTMRQLSPDCAPCAVWAAGPRSTCCCGGWDDCTCFPATTSAPAATCNAGSGSWNRSTMRGCSGRSRSGRPSRAWSTSTSCSGACSSRARATQGPRRRWRSRVKE